jgi:hypothetical protein
VGAREVHEVCGAVYLDGLSASCAMEMVCHLRFVVCAAEERWAACLMYFEARGDPPATRSSALLLRLYILETTRWFVMGVSTALERLSR